MSFSIVYITFPNQQSAKDISGSLVEKRLAACANIFPITSAYWWKGDIQNEKEFVAILKTRNDLLSELESMVNTVHPYDVPCIMQMEVKANEAYEKWIHEQTEDQ